jgi:hypothetical protein
VAAAAAAAESFEMPDIDFMPVSSSAGAGDEGGEAAVSPAAAVAAAVSGAGKVPGMNRAAVRAAKMATRDKRKRDQALPVESDAIRSTAPAAAAPKPSKRSRPQAEAVSYGGVLPGLSVFIAVKVTLESMCATLLVQELMRGC